MSRRYSWVLPIGFFFVSLGLSTTSCEKEAVEPEPLPPSYEIRTYSPSDDKAWGLISEFSGGLQSGREENSLSRPANQSLWLLEANWNATFGNISAEGDVTTLPFRTHFTLPVEQRDAEFHVAGPELAKGYREISSHVQTLLEEYKAQHPDLSVTVYAIDIDGKLSPEAGLEVDGHLILLSVNNGTARITCDFEGTDYWVYSLLGGVGSGRCAGPLAGTGIMRDATTEIESRLNHCVLNTRSQCDYLTDVTIDAILPPTASLDNPADASPFDNQQDLYLFCRVDLYPGFDNCISPEDMDFYLHGATTAGDIINSTSNPIFKYDLEGVETFGPPAAPFHMIRHKLTVFSGICRNKMGSSTL